MYSSFFIISHACTYLLISNDSTDWNKRFGCIKITIFPIGPYFVTFFIPLTIGFTELITQHFTEVVALYIKFVDESVELTRHTLAPGSSASDPWQVTGNCMLSVSNYK